MKKLYLKIYGSVQGVNFRSAAKHKASELSLDGWIKNMSDGTVEVIAEGGEEGLKKLLNWCKVGPQFGEVEKVEESWSDAEKSEFDEFRVVC